MKKRVPNKHVMYTCHHCGGAIYNGERSKVYTTSKGVQHYHFDHGLDCRADELAALHVMCQMELEMELDHVAVRGEE